KSVGGEYKASHKLLGGPQYEGIYHAVSLGFPEETSIGTRPALPPRVLFEVHSLKLLAAHCFLNTPYITHDSLLEEKTKMIDPQGIMATMPRKGQPTMQWRYSQVGSMELDKFLEDVRNGIYPLMNFAVSRPHVLPRALSQSQEDLQTVKTPTPEPVEVETRRSPRCTVA
ncbi:unnamed protein product, partial [Staurois parvus]